MQKKWAQYIRQVLRLLTLQAEPSVTPSRPNAIPGNASDSRATINKAMTDPRLARANIDIAVARVSEEQIKAVKEQERQMIPLGRRGDPDDVARWVVIFSDP
jgi:NAD(P)-dependent dehydrogenase (short-subunit alcohol dehydrogenase family)